MHKYLRAVGFSCFERKSQIDDFFKDSKDYNAVVDKIKNDRNREFNQSNNSENRHSRFRYGKDTNRIQDPCDDKNDRAREDDP